MANFNRISIKYLRCMHQIYFCKRCVFSAINASFCHFLYKKKEKRKEAISCDFFFAFSFWHKSCFTWRYLQHNWSFFRYALKIQKSIVVQHMVFISKKCIEFWLLEVIIFWPKILLEKENSETASDFSGKFMQKHL